MKNKKLLVSVLTLVTSLTSCDFVAFSGEEFVGYADGSVVTNENLKLNLSNYNIYENSDNYLISFNINIINTDSDSITTSLDDFTCYRESDGADYGIGTYSDISDITLRCDLRWSGMFLTNLPTSPEEENYYMTFNLAGENYKFYLYDKPEELKKKFSVNLYIDGILEESTSILEAESLSNIEWLSTDYAYYCTDWYYDETLEKSVGNDILTDSINLYGKKETVLSYLHDSYFSVMGVNYIPKSNTIVIPRVLQEKPVKKIFASAFYYNLDELTTIYIPYTITYISKYNFTKLNNLQKIYFDGTSLQWESINEATIPSNVEIIYNTYI